MPPSKGPAEGGHTLQAQEQGTGTTPRRSRNLRGTRSLSLWEGEEGTGGEPWRTRGCGSCPSCWGGHPEEARHPLSGGRRLLWSDCGCYSAPRHGGSRVGRAPGRGQPRDGTHCAARGGCAPAAASWPPWRDRTGGVWRQPSRQERMRSTGVQLVPDAFPRF